MPRRFRSHRAKRTWNEVLDIRARFYERGETIQSIADRYNMGYMTAYNLIRGFTYRSDVPKREETNRDVR